MAQLRRLFVDPAAIAASGATPAGPHALAADEAHYARDVLRLEDGAAVDLLDGHGNGAPATLHLAGRGRKAEAEVTPTGPFTRHPSLAQTPQITLVMPLPKGERADWMVEKLTELAVAALVVVDTKRSIGGGAAAGRRHERLLRVAQAASRQARHGRVPTLTAAALPLATALAPDGPVAALASAGPTAALAGSGTGADACLWVADLGPELVHLAAAGRALAGSGHRHVVLLGPEGGLTPDELNQARGFGYTPVGLGPHVLRMETAAVAAAVALQQT